MVHGSVLLVPAAPHRVDHLQVQARAAPALPPAMEMEMDGLGPCQPPASPAATRPEGRGRLDGRGGLCRSSEGWPHSQEVCDR